MDGLDEIFAHLHAEGRAANDATAREAMDLLEGAHNYIPSSEVTRREYAYILKKEYEEYLERRAREAGSRGASPACSHPYYTPMT